MAKTKVFKEKFKGKPMFVIRKVDTKGKPNMEERVVFSCGIDKAQAILNHNEELIKYVEENSDEETDEEEE